VAIRTRDLPNHQKPAGTLARNGPTAVISAATAAEAASLFSPATFPGPNHIPAHATLQPYLEGCRSLAKGVDNYFQSDRTNGRVAALTQRRKVKSLTPFGARNRLNHG
jgi:hypothetical protein